MLQLDCWDKSDKWISIYNPAFQNKVGERKRQECVLVAFSFDTLPAREETGCDFPLSSGISVSAWETSPSAASQTTLLFTAALKWTETEEVSGINRQDEINV